MSVSGRGVRWSINGIPIDFAQVHSTNTVGGRNPAPVEVGSLSRYLQGILHPRWCRISSINSIIDLQLVNMVPTKSTIERDVIPIWIVFQQCRGCRTDGGRSNDLYNLPFQFGATFSSSQKNGHVFRTAR